MNPVIWLLVGAFIGGLACAELVPLRPRERILNVLAGASGALIARWLLSTALGAQALAASEFSLPNLIEAAFGAVLLIVLVNLGRLIRSP